MAKDTAIRDYRKLAKRDLFDLLEAATDSTLSPSERQFAGNMAEQKAVALKALPKPKASKRAKGVHTYELRSATGALRVVNEPAPYGPGSPHSLFADQISLVSPMPMRMVAAGAKDRIEKHRQDTERELQARHISSNKAVRDAGYQALNDNDVAISYRDLSTAFGAGGEGLVPQQWLISEWYDGVRSEATLAALCKAVPLPPGCSNIVVPGLSSVANPQPRPSENQQPAAAVNTTDIIVGVRSYAGETLISQQLFERGNGFDQIVMQSSANGFADQLEADLLWGSGVMGTTEISGEILGLANVPSVVTVAYTSGAPSTQGIIQNIGYGVSSVGQARMRPATHIGLTPQRWASIAFDYDTNDEPVLRPGIEGAFLGGLPVLQLPYLNGSLTAGSDSALVCRPEELVILTSAPAFTILPQNGANQLSVSMVWHAYIAFIGGRFPSGTCFVSGTGFATSAFTDS